MIGRAKLILALIAICSLPVFAAAKQQETCKQYTKPVIANTVGTTGQNVKLDDLIDHKDQYIGKTVTVEGEMHRIFSDHVFTIEDDDLLKDDDVLIISDVPRAQAVVALEKSIEPGKNVRVTGYVHPYDKAKLECLYGPLQTESRDGHSFTKAPVLIVQGLQASAPTAGAAPPPPAPAATATSQPAPQRLETAQPEGGAPAALPQTASDLPFVGLIGIVLVLTALAIRIR